MLKSYKELEAGRGKPGIVAPGADAKPEDRAAWEAEVYKTLGVPDKPEAYGLKPADQWPEHMGEYNTEFLGEFSKAALDLKLTPAQAAGLQKWYDGLTLKTVEAMQATRKAEQDQANSLLDGHFTKLFGDQKTVAVEKVKQAMIKAIPDAAVRTALEKALPNEALVVIAALDKHYQSTYGQSDQNQGDQGNAGGKSLEDMRAEAKKLMATPEYRDPMNKGNKDMRAKVDQLYKDIGALTDAGKKK